MTKRGWNWLLAPIGIAAMAIGFPLVLSTSRLPPTKHFVPTSKELAAVRNGGFAIPHYCKGGPSSVSESPNLSLTNRDGDRQFSVYVGQQVALTYGADTPEFYPQTELCPIGGGSDGFSETDSYFAQHSGTATIFFVGHSLRPDAIVEVTVLSSSAPSPVGGLVLIFAGAVAFVSALSTLKPFRKKWDIERDQFGRPINDLRRADDAAWEYSSGFR